MGGYTGNTCDILTIFPMGLICSSTNAFTPFTNDGAITLYITGGTPPYVINWSNGSHSQNLTNLQAGDYTATVIDYFGDFTATTTCTVGFDTFYIERFSSCSDPNDEIYFTTNLNSPYITNKVYSLNNQLGCWIREGIELYSAQTYNNFSAVTVSGPFDTCPECLPSVPAIFNTSGLCFTTTSSNSVTQTQYFSANTINGYPSWSSSTSNQTIYFNNSLSAWRVSGWTGLGIPQQQSILSPPIGVWSIIGLPNNFPTPNISVTQGECEDVLQVNISSNPPSCEGANNGNITITSVLGGSAPYTYSLVNDPSFYQASNTFTNLSEGSYTVYVQDILGSVSINQVVLDSLVSPIQYNLNLSLVPANGTVVTNTSTQSIKNWYWEVTVTPPLPIGKEINFSLTHTTSSSLGSTSNGAPTISYTQTTGTTGGGQYQTLIGPTTNSTTATTVACSVSNNYTQYITNTTLRQYTAKITGTGGNDKIFGNVTQGVTVTLAGSPCATTATLTDSISISNILLVNQNDCEIMSTTVQPLSFGITKTGTIAAVGVSG
jgi:hypothetical protein